MRTRSQFSVEQLNAVTTENVNASALTESVVGEVTGVYAKNNPLFKMATRLLKLQQEFNALLGSESGIITGGNPLGSGGFGEVEVTGSVAGL